MAIRSAGIVALVVVQSVFSALVGFYEGPRIASTYKYMAVRSARKSPLSPTFDLPPVTFTNQRGELWHITLIPPEAMPGGPDILGFTIQEKRVIYVNSVSLLSDMQDTVIHELIHVVLSTSTSDQIVTVHEMIYREAPPLQVIFANNPDLMAWLSRK